MKILVINSGSSSLKYKLFDSGKELVSGHVDGIGLDTCEVRVKVAHKTHVTKFKVPDHVDAVMIALKSLSTYKVIKSLSEISAVGHRVVHGGERYHQSVIIDDQIIRDIRKLSVLAPLHNPDNLAGIIACRKVLPKVKQYAVFDTSFHLTVPEVNFTYALPHELYTRHGIRRFGFHGISHKHVAESVRAHRVISCHLGNGSSVCAIRGGKSFNISMGFTPLEGLPMGTRSGDIDPAIIFYLVHNLGHKIKDVEDMLNHHSGLLGIGKHPDVRELRQASLKGDAAAKLALDILVAKVVFYISGYVGQMGGVDAIVFTGGIGEGAWYLRRKILNHLDFLGIKLDKEANKQGKHEITTKDSKVKAYIVKCDEELEIARQHK